MKFENFEPTDVAAGLRTLADVQDHVERVINLSRRTDVTIEELRAEIEAQLPKAATAIYEMRLYPWALKLSEFCREFLKSGRQRYYALRELGLEPPTRVLAGSRWVILSEVPGWLKKLPSGELRRIRKALTAARRPELKRFEIIVDQLLEEQGA